MPLFSRRPKAPLTDQQWLARGYDRFDITQGPYLGAPESLVMGGDLALSRGDLAAGLFFYARAIDRMHTHMLPSSSVGRAYSANDLVVFDRYVAALEDVLGGHPDADVVGGNNFDAKYTVGSMRGIVLGAVRAGVDPRPYELRIDRVTALASIEPWW